MLDTLAIRQANAADLGGLLGLYRHLHPGDAALDPAQAARLLEGLAAYPGSAVLVGICAGAIAATCTLVVIPNLTRGGAPYGLIENVVTDPRFRQRGFGKAVLRAALAAAWRHDCYKVMLLTGSKQPSTLRFYADAGFEQSKTGFQARRIAPRAD